MGQIEKFFSLINGLKCFFFIKIFTYVFLKHFFLLEDDIFLTKTSDIELKVLVQAIALLSSVFDSLENTVALKVSHSNNNSLINL